MPILSLLVLDRCVQIRCEDAETYRLLATNYGFMQGVCTEADLHYRVSKTRDNPSFLIQKENRLPLEAADESEFLFLFEKDLTIELQKLRKDLYFIHAAVLEFQREALMLVAPSGSGKSLTTWALLHHGFQYLSDELGPIDLKTLTVLPYARALCLKDTPPSWCPLPATTLFTPDTLHLPTSELPNLSNRRAVPLTAIFFLQYCPEAGQPHIQLLSKAEAAARLFANALNPLAHSGEGLDGAIAIATKTTSFQLSSAELSATCELVKTTMQKLPYRSQDRTGIPAPY